MTSNQRKKGSFFESPGSYYKLVCYPSLGIRREGFNTDLFCGISQLPHGVFGLAVDGRSAEQKLTFTAYFLSYLAKQISTIPLPQKMADKIYLPIFLSIHPSLYFYVYSYTQTDTPVGSFPQIQGLIVRVCNLLHKWWKTRCRFAQKTAGFPK